MKWICIAESIALFHWVMAFVFALACPPDNPLCDAIFLVAVVAPALYWTAILCREVRRRWHESTKSAKSPSVIQTMIVASIWLASSPWLVAVPIALGYGGDFRVAWALGAVAVLLSASVAVCVWRLLKLSGALVGAQARRLRRARVKLLVLACAYVMIVSASMRGVDAVGPILWAMNIIVPTMLRQMVPFVPARRR